MALTSPVVLIAFNRPDHTAASFAQIRAQRPERLFLVADGPRPGHPADELDCERVRDVVTAVDWPCTVMTNFADQNLGLKRRVTSGLDWVFSHVDRAVILEDDCVASADFFEFTDALLERYVSDERIAAVSGDNFLRRSGRDDASYHFSKYCHVWGWATWRRAWSLFDADLSFWPEWRLSPEWVAIHPDPVERSYWETIFDRFQHGEFDTWDYPWQASIWRAGMLTATPNVNLVSNTGFGPQATHNTVRYNRPGVRARPMGTLVHPTTVEADRLRDRQTFNRHYNGRAMRRRQMPGGRAIWIAERAARRCLRPARRGYHMLAAALRRYRSAVSRHS